MQSRVAELRLEAVFYLISPWEVSYPVETSFSFSSYLSLEAEIITLHNANLLGVSKIKEKWSGYYREKTLKREIFLVVSPKGKYVAVCSGNEIVILDKANDYMEPYGIYEGMYF